MGVEPTYQPWEGRILPMNYTRAKHITRLLYHKIFYNQAQIYLNIRAASITSFI